MGGYNLGEQRTSTDFLCRGVENISECEPLITLLPLSMWATTYPGESIKRNVESQNEAPTYCTFRTID